MSDNRLQALIREALASNDSMLGYKAFLESQRQGIDPVELPANGDFLSCELADLMDERMPYHPRAEYIELGRDYAYSRICGDILEIRLRANFLRVTVNFQYVNMKWIIIDDSFEGHDNETDLLPACKEIILNRIMRDIETHSEQILSTIKESQRKGADIEIRFAVGAIYRLQQEIIRQQKMCGEAFLRKQK